VTLREATAADAPALASIYNEYVHGTVITFEVDAVQDHDMAARVLKVQHAGLPWLIAEDSELLHDLGADAVGAGAAILGFAYASPFQERLAYRYSLETTVYLRDGAAGRGIGTALYDELLERLRSLTPAHSPHAPVHRTYARIALPNGPSVALHERFGYRQVATLNEVGFKLDRWIDVGFWELSLEGAS
jgi:phosphinothricin acetyltransferase